MIVTDTAKRIVEELKAGAERDADRRALQLVARVHAAQKLDSTGALRFSEARKIVDELLTVRMDEPEDNA